jgi:hypothetical protein
MRASAVFTWAGAHKVLPFAKRNYSRGASAPELQSSSYESTAHKTKGRSAERRIVQCPRSTGIRCHKPAPGRGSASGGTRSPSGAPRGACQSERTPRLSPGRASRDQQNAGVTRVVKSRLSGAPRAPVIVPAGIAVCSCANCVHLFAMPGLPRRGLQIRAEEPHPAPPSVRHRSTPFT